MDQSFAERVEFWCDAVGLPAAARPAPAQLDRGFANYAETCRPGVDPARVRSWERRFGYRLPGSLKAWLLLSDGFYAGGGPLVHPLAALGPMVPFAEIPGLAMQPESWFELGNPNRETVCIDLGYRWPGGDYPLFTSGDDERQTRPRLIAPGFTTWFLKVLHRGGAEFWLEPGFLPLGDPWGEHRRRVPMPPLPEPLQPFRSRVRELLRQGVDDGLIAHELRLSRTEVELIVRHVQHAAADLATIGADARP